MPTASTAPLVASARPELWRITDRRTFRALRVQGHRVRRGPVTVTWLPPAPGDASPCRAGFTVGRQAGSAVLRNRVKRRLRAALRAIAAEGHLPGGALLVGAGPSVADLPWSALVSILDAAIAEVQA